MNTKETMRSKPKQEKRNFRALSPEERASVLAELNAPAYRARQVEKWLLRDEVQSFDAMTNLPKALRESLAARFSLEGAVVTARQESRDGTRKYLVQFEDGVSVECVGMPEKERLSVCVSTQAGCAMGCAFCATGAYGLTRSLKAREIVDQVGIVRKDFDQKVTSVVFMGQGEPFANYEATCSALRILNAPGPEVIGARRLTVSTAGIISGIRRFAKEPEQFTLAVSLHSAVQHTRDTLMPAVKRYPLTHLHEALKEYVERTQRRPTYEFAPIAGINDTESEIKALVDFCAGTLCHVNLIRLNPLPNSPFAPSSDTRIRTIQQSLRRASVETTIRESRGADIDAACGLLRQRRAREHAKRIEVAIG